MPTPRTKTAAKSAAKPVAKSSAKPAAKSRAAKPAVMVPDRRVKRTTYAKMGNALNNIGKKK